jgi:hypothetical protein
MGSQPFGVQPSILPSAGFGLRLERKKDQEKVGDTLTLLTGRPIEDRTSPFGHICINAETVRVCLSVVDLIAHGIFGCCAPRLDGSHGAKEETRRVGPVESVGV